MFICCAVITSTLQIQFHIPAMISFQKKRRKNDYIHNISGAFTFNFFLLSWCTTSTHIENWQCLCTVYATNMNTSLLIFIDFWWKKIEMNDKREYYYMLCIWIFFHFDQENAEVHKKHMMLNYYYRDRAVLSACQVNGKTCCHRKWMSLFLLIFAHFVSLNCRNAILFIWPRR